MMTQEKLLDFIKMDNMRHILPIIRHNTKLMNDIKGKLTTDVNANNNMIISEVKKAICSFDEGRYLYYESAILALTEVL